MKTIVISLLVGAASLLAAQTQAAEKKVQKADVPKPVLDAIATKFPGAKLTGFEQIGDDGKTYEVNFQVGGTKMEAQLSSDGKIVVEESKIAAEHLPKPVKAGLTSSKYKGWKIASAEKVVKEGKTDAPSYELLLQNKAAKMEVVFDHEGKITEETDKSAKAKN